AILEDSSRSRVFELQGAISSAKTSYSHRSVGGYRAVRPKKSQELYDYHITQGNQEILNMLNVKYILDTDEEGNTIPILNDEAYGNAWFVNQVQVVNSADEVMKSLENLNKNTAILNLIDFPIKAKEVTNIHFQID